MRHAPPLHTWQGRLVQSRQPIVTPEFPGGRRYPVGTIFRVHFVSDVGLTLFHGDSGRYVTLVSPEDVFLLQRQGDPQ